jgi:hypothetical protein
MKVNCDLFQVIKQNSFSNLQESQTTFDDWWHVYNYIRPHEALQLLTPSTRYIPSPHSFPATLPPVTYEADEIIRKVDMVGKIYFQGRTFRISAAFRYQPVALRPADQDGIFNVFFCTQKVAQISLRVDNQS